MVGAIAIILFIVSIQYSNLTSEEILQIAADETRSNTRIQAHDLGRILVNQMGAITSNLEIVAHNPSIQLGEHEGARAIINTAQDSTSDLTNFYMWLDKEGKLVWLSNINQTTYMQIRGTDLSQRSYFTETRENLKTYYGSLIISNDNVPRIYVAYPIIDGQTAEFSGIVSAGIRLDALGSTLQSQLSPDFESSFGMIDREGVVLYSGNQILIGKSVLGDEFQSALPAEIKQTFNEFLNHSIAVGQGVEDFSIGDVGASIAFEPVKFDGEQFATLYIVAQHRVEENVELVVNQQKNFSLVMVLVISGVAVAIGGLIVTLNRRLEETVESRTGQLRAKTEELKRSYDSLSAAKQQLEVHGKLQKEFINIAAHELRTPTQAILGYAELLQMNPEAKDEMIKSIYRNSIRLQRLTSDILDVTRIESESLTLEKEEFSLKDIIQGAIQDTRNQVANGKVKFIYEPKDITVRADRIRINQVISNLLDNAAKFTKQGTIQVSTEKQDVQVLVSVKDTGSGIDESIMPRLFSKFATKSDRGTGLGLFISRSIIEAHDGRIWCGNNSDGAGATFSFSLPIS